MAVILALPVSLLLLWFMLRLKKDDPFPKGGLVRLLIAGALSIPVSSILFFVVALILMLIRIGPANVGQLIQASGNSTAFTQKLAELQAQTGARSPLWVLVSTLLTTGLMEELCKYAAYRAAVRKEGMIRTWMDAVVCCAVVGLAFELLENVMYAEQNGAITAIIRNLSPVHFCCAVIMGYYFGKSLVTGRRSFRVPALLIPTVIHTLFDTALNLMKDEESPLVMLGPVAFLLSIVLTIVVVVKIVKWRKSGKLDVPLAGAPAEPQS